MGKSLSLTIGWVLFVSGLILTPLPPPLAFGLFLLMPGLALLIVHSSYMRRSMRYLRQKYSTVDRVVLALEAQGPKQMSRVLKLTRPPVAGSRPHPSKKIAKYVRGRAQRNQGFTLTCRMGAFARLALNVFMVKDREK